MPGSEEATGQTSKVSGSRIRPQTHLVLSYLGVSKIGDLGEHFPTENKYYHV